MNRNYHNRKGFTLAEAMMALVILAVSAGAVVLPYSSGAAVLAEGSRRTLAAKLAGDLLDEISVTDYSDIMDEYGGYSEAQGEICEARSWDTFDNEIYSKFSRTIVCQYHNIGSGRNITRMGIKATVTVSYDGRELVKISTLIAE
ncbi:MAG: prepilin-type N-terminal cleavage/methylation domain-containing protein [Planctomycetes bacterium]|nr:prepilin-type N-terminal cleavage/methylation domain-containing protein [Planctomycetota bacterium]